MGKTKRYNKDEDNEDQERLLDLVKMAGRKPVAPPGKFHSERVKPLKREKTRQELKNLVKEYNN